MNIKSLFILIFSSLLLRTGNLHAQSSPQASEVETFSLQACIDYAFKNSATVKNATLDMRSADYRVNEVKADGLPQVNGQANFTENIAIQRAFLPAVFFAEDPINNPPPEDAPPVPVQFGVRYSGNAAVTLNQLIFDGSFFLGLKAAKVYRELASKSYQKSKVDVADAVSKAYYGVLVSQERKKLLSENLIRIDSLYRQTNALYQNGFVEKIDVDRIKVTYNNLKTQQSQLQRVYDLSMNLLKFQMGMDLKERILLSDKLEVSNLETMLLDEDFDFKQRIEYSLLETQRQLDELNIRQFQVRYMPNLYLNVTYGANAGNNNSAGEILDVTNDWFSFGSYGLTLSVPIFDGMRKKYQIQQARLSLQQTENNMQNLQNSLELEIAQNKINLRNSLGSLDSQKENMELAAEIFRVANIKYQEGVGSSIEVVEAESSYKEAETNYYNALYEAYLAKVDYMRAKGQLLGEVE